MAGISVCRNQDLANVFYRLRLIEAYGTGIGKIMKAYEGLDLKPKIEATKNTFKIILPNINSKTEIGQVEGTKDSDVLKSDEKKVLECAKENKSITTNEVMSLLNVSSSTALRVIRKLIQENLLTQNGKARNAKYAPVKC